MSVVIAIKDGDRVLMGGDCQVSCGGNKATLTSPHLMKVWEVEGHPNTLMGGVGALRDLNIAYATDTYYDTTRDELKKELDFKFVVNKIVPSVLNLFTDHGRATNKNGIVSIGSSFLFAQKDKCYLIDSDGCVLDLTFDGECMAIGSGATIAQSAYNTLVDIEGLNAEERLLKALTQACEEDLYVNFPVYIKNTENPKQIIIYDGYDLYKMGYEDEDIETDLNKDKEEEKEEDCTEEQ